LDLRVEAEHEFCAVILLAFGKGDKMESSLIIGKAKLYTLPLIAFLNLLAIFPGMLLGGSFGVSIFVLLAIILGQAFYWIPIGISSMLIVGLILYLIPIINGNNWVCRIVKQISGIEILNGNATICQISFTPRLHRGIRGFLEDADDVGYIQFSDNSVVFRGDQIQMDLPYSSVKTFSCANAGWRTFWVTGRKIKIETDAFEGYDHFTISERQSSTILSSRRISESMIREFKRGLENENCRHGGA
jgi:hypothetical protein